MKKILLEHALFVNRAPFKKVAFNFNENEITLLTSVNGKGKTTILSYITDAFYEMARKHFQIEFAGRENKYYRISTAVMNLNPNEPSFVYLRFRTNEGIAIDYLEIDGESTLEQYNENVQIDNKIPYESIKSVLRERKHVREISKNFDKRMAIEIFKSNILTYFPAYRFEQPGYLNDPYKIKLDFKKDVNFDDKLTNPIEVISNLPIVTNWILDLILDLSINQFAKNGDQNDRIQFNNLNSLVTNILSSKFNFPLRFGIGKRHFGGVRIQIVNSVTNALVYPSIFNLSSGECALLAMFCEILRQGDNLNENEHFSMIKGIVLIDEIDKHLHIKLQKEILPRLLELFPNVQFVVSSHSPFLSLGLSDITQHRSRILDLDSGLAIQPQNDPQYQEVYQMMVKENERFKEIYETIKTEFDSTKELQIITEGKNTEHIRKAISVIDNSLTARIKVVGGIEDRSGDKQLKNAFEIMSKATHIGKFLFVWDCDSINIVNPIVENTNFHKFCFEKNMEHKRAKKGIENLYDDTLFTEDVYDTTNNEIDYGGSKTEKIFNKNRFIGKLNALDNEQVFIGFVPLIEKIKTIINAAQ